MNEDPITADAFQSMVDAMPSEARMYLRHCLETVTRCFMDDSTQVGVLISGDIKTGETHLYHIGLDHTDATGLLSAVLASRMQDIAAMNIPKEKLN
jgi:hypothetical protein